MRGVVVIVLVGCYSPHPQPGSPCDPGPCPFGLVCSEVTMTCELPSTDAARAADSAPTIDGCTPSPELCGDGIDQDCDGVDPPCPANDAPDGAIDVTAGGMFTADLSAAHDDAGNTSCGGDGGRDVFYKVTLAEPQVFYFDTFGSSFGTIVRVFPGNDCTDLAASPTCSALACGGAQSQLALSLPAATSCIVIDQHAGDTSGMLALTVKPGGRDGMLLGPGMQTYSGSSCSGVNAAQPNGNCVSGDSKTSDDVGYFFTVCPAQTLNLDASTCVDPAVTDFDTVIYLRAVANNATLGCNDDSSACMPRPDRPDHADGSIISDVPATGPNLFWLTVDGYGGACGPYQLDTNLR